MWEGDSGRVGQKIPKVGALVWFWRQQLKDQPRKWLVYETTAGGHLAELTNQQLTPALPLCVICSPTLGVVYHNPLQVISFLFLFSHLYIQTKSRQNGNFHAHTLLTFMVGCWNGTWPQLTGCTVAKIMQTSRFSSCGRFFDASVHDGEGDLWLLSGIFA